MKEWICVRTTVSSQDWTCGNIYKETPEGRLRDDKGALRLTAHEYNRAKTTFFSEYDLGSLENK